MRPFLPVLVLLAPLLLAAVVVTPGASAHGEEGHGPWNPGYTWVHEGPHGENMTSRVATTPYTSTVGGTPTTVPTRQLRVSRVVDNLTVVDSYTFEPGTYNLKRYAHTETRTVDGAPVVLMTTATTFTPAAPFFRPGIGEGSTWVVSSHAVVQTSVYGAGTSTNEYDVTWAFLARGRGNLTVNGTVMDGIRVEGARTGSDERIEYLWSPEAKTFLTRTGRFFATEPFTQRLLAFDVDNAPKATFQYTPSLPWPGEIVTFTGNGSHDDEGALAALTWDLGDGVQRDGVIATRVYDAPGDHPMSFTVRDAAGQTHTARHTIEVREAPTLGIAVTSTLAEDPIGFTVAGDDAPRYAVRAADWTFGDGRRSTDIDPEHVYRAPGNYTVTARLTLAAFTGPDAGEEHTLTLTRLLEIGQPGPQDYLLRIDSPLEGATVAPGDPFRIGYSGPFNRIDLVMDGEVLQTYRYPYRGLAIPPGLPPGTYTFTLAGYRFSEPAVQASVNVTIPRQGGDDPGPGSGGDGTGGPGPGGSGGDGTGQDGTGDGDATQDPAPSGGRAKGWGFLIPAPPAFLGAAAAALAALVYDRRKGAR